MVTQMQGPLWTLLTFVAHIFNAYVVAIRKYRAEWHKKMEQISLDGSAPTRLDINELHMLFEHMISRSL